MCNLCDKDMKGGLKRKFKKKKKESKMCNPNLNVGNVTFLKLKYKIKV